eukprot:g20156.t2
MPEAGSGLEALAWRLLREEDEVEWLRPSLEGYELVKPLRARTEDLLARLLARVAAEAPKVWENFEGREEAEERGHW